MLNKDFKDMLRYFIATKVDFLLVGGYAMAAHGFPRATKDMDVWIWAQPQNAVKVYEALAQFGVPVEKINPKDFETRGIVYQIGIPPCRIDIMTWIVRNAFRVQAGFKLKVLRFP